MLIKCGFSTKIGIPDYRRWKEEFVVYEPGDVKPFLYLPKDKVARHAKTIQLGDWIETHDDYVVPVIKSRLNMFRIAAIHSQNYMRSLVLTGAVDITFKRDENYHDFKGEGRLTNKRKEFCRRYALTGNLALAASETYTTASPRTANHRGWRLLKQEKIRKEIDRVLRELMKVSGKKESEFFLNRMERHQNNMDGIVSKMLAKLDNGGLEKEDATFLLDVLQKQQEAMLINAKLLGYGNREENTTTQFNYPEITDAVEVGSKAITAPKGKK